MKKQFKSMQSNFKEWCTKMKEMQTDLKWPEKNPEKLA